MTSRKGLVVIPLLLAAGVLSSEKLLAADETAALEPQAIPRNAELRATQIAATGQYCLILSEDGTAWELGGYSGWEYKRVSPRKVGGLTDVLSLATGGPHSLALRRDGTVWAWGINSSGQLGDGTTSSAYIQPPRLVSGLTGVSGVAGGSGHSLAVTTDGSVWVWGANNKGQLGNGTTTTQLTPVRLNGLSGVAKVASVGEHSVALKIDGTVWAWGWNEQGQLGDGTISTRLTPVQVSGLTGIVDIVATYSNSYALKGDGTVWAWGHNDRGQLGNGTVENRLTPSKVFGLAGAVAVASGGGFAVAVRNDGTVWNWGGNNMGQLGDGTTVDRLTPVQVRLTAVRAVAGMSMQGLALRSDGSIWTWGYLDIGSPVAAAAARLTPAQVSGLTGMVAVAAADAHSLGLRNDGTVWAWGENGDGRLGDGTTVTRLTPVRVIGLEDVTSVAAQGSGDAFNLALKRNGTVWAWGRNNGGQLGDGTATDRFTPGQVSGLTGIVAIAAGSSHSLGLRNDGTVFAWGWNGSGELGTGTATDRFTPGQVSGLTGIVAVAAGSSHSLGLRNDGTVFAWGWNWSGQLGDGTTTSRFAPVQVNGLNGVVALAASDNQSFALRSDGTVWAWGNNYYGQLGDGTSITRLAPVQVRIITGVVTLAGARNNTFALRRDGTLWAWGVNYGLLGDGTRDGKYTAVQVGKLDGVSGVAGGPWHSLALKTDGTVYAWGFNSSGNLGNGTSPSQPIPVQVAPLGSPDLTISKNHGGDFFAVGVPASYTLSVTNVGHTATSGTITVTDTLPPGLDNPTGFGENWTCTATRRIVTCTHPGPIEPGASSAITLNVGVAPAAYPGVTNIATVSNTSDLDFSNNTTGDPLYVTGTGCSYSVTPATTAFPFSGGSAGFNIQTDSSCPWTVLNLPAWISVSGSNNGTGPGTITLNAGPNTGAARSATVMIAGVPITLTQSAFICNYSLSMVGQTISSSGGTGSVDIITGPGCPWTASLPAPWLVLTPGTTGAGPGRIYFQASANSSASSRSTTLTIAGRAFTVEQAGTLPGSATFAGGLPQIASGEGWKTTFTITNIGSSSATIRLNYWANDGSALTLPMSFPQIANSGLIQGTTIDRTIDAGATLLIESEASTSAPVLAGWAELLSTGPVTGQAVFRQSSSGREQEAGVPLESRTASTYLLQFDNVNGYATGIAAANHSTSPVSLTVIQRDEAGRQIGTDSLPLAARGHTSFDLKTRWPSLANQRGTIEVRGSMPGSFSILGLRFHPQGPFTTLPVAAK